MEPLSTAASAWSIAKIAGEISKSLYEFRKSLKNRELKHGIDGILDQVRDLKQPASELEDESQALQEKLRFKSNEYEFRTHFYYHKSKPDQALCPKYFAEMLRLR